MSDSPYRTPEASDSVSDGPDISADVREIQIVTGGLIMGAVFFMGVALVTNEGELGMEPDFLFYAGAAFAATAFMAHVIIPMVMRRQQISQLDKAQLRDGELATRMTLLLGVYRSTHIVACAFLEGAAFFNLIGYLLDSFVGSLAIAVFLILCMAFRFPSEDRIRSWVRRVAEEAALDPANQGTTTS